MIFQVVFGGFRWFSVNEWFSVILRTPPQPSTSTSCMRPSHLTTIARGEGCYIRKRMNDRNVRGIVLFIRLLCRCAAVPAHEAYISTCICCMVMGHVITSNIMAYQDKHQLLHSNQHGFRKKLSCETQLIQFLEDSSATLNESGQTDIIVMDFSKAFGKVDRKRLLLKLHRFGINNDVITWIGSFLSNRTQRVVLEGEESDTCPVMSGVPQDSVLGPYMFLLYINDMPGMIGSNIRLFVDDTIVYLTVSNQADC